MVGLLNAIANDEDLTAPQRERIAALLDDARDAIEGVMSNEVRCSASLVCVRVCVCVCACVCV